MTASGTTTNTAQVSQANESDIDSTPANDDPAEDDQDSATIVADAQADLSLSKSAAGSASFVGDQETFTVTATNDGPDAATGVTVSDLLPAGLTWVSDTSAGAYDPGTGVWTIGNLGVFASATLDIVVNIDSAAPHVNIAQVATSDQSDPDSTPANDDPLEDDQSQVIVDVDPLIDLTLAKSVSAPSAAVGSDVTWTLVLANDGPSDASGVTVTDVLPAGLTYVSDTSTGAYDPISGAWTVPTLAAGGSVSFDLVTTVTVAGSITNVAEVAAANDRLLQQLGAIDDERRVTAAGRQMVSIPLHPRLSRFMLEATERGVEKDAALVSALLTERDPFRGSSTGTSNETSDCDIVKKVDRFNDPRTNELNASAIRQVERASHQILRVMGGKRVESIQCDTSKDQRLRRALLAAYPDRVARRRDPDSDRGVMVGGRGVRLQATSDFRHGDLFLCIDVDSKGTEATVRSTSAVEPSWLDQRQIRDVAEVSFDSSLGALKARKRRYYQDLLLKEVPVECVANADTAELLASQVRPDLQSLLGEQDRNAVEFISRAQFLSAEMPELELPLIDDAALDGVLFDVCQTRISIAELQAAPWLSHLRGRYDYHQLQLIDQHAPAHMTVPSGNSIAIRYDAGKPPIMEVRIQEVFGWHDTPRVAGGNVAIQLHLLGPNYRPQQITGDLANFWRETYRHIRKELRRRYPKHHWPENPTTATATRNALKPRTS